MIKNYLVIADDLSVPPVFSNAEQRAREYAIEMGKDAAPGTLVHIFRWVDSASFGVHWQGQKPTKAKKSRRNFTAEEKKQLYAMVEQGVPKAEMANRLGRSLQSIHCAVYKRGWSDLYRQAVSEAS